MIDVVPAKVVGKTDGLVGEILDQRVRRIGQYEVSIPLVAKKGTPEFGDHWRTLPRIQRPMRATELLPQREAYGGKREDYDTRSDCPPNRQSTPCKVSKTKRKRGQCLA